MGYNILSPGMDGSSTYVGYIIIYIYTYIYTYIHTYIYILYILFIIIDTTNKIWMRIHVEF